MANGSTGVPLNLILPENGADTNQWGLDLNTNLNTINTAIGALQTVPPGSGPPTTPSLTSSNIGISSVPPSTNASVTWWNGSAPPGQQIRWELYENTNAESGGNAGSNLVLESYNDSGQPLLPVMTFLRTGAVGFGGPVTFSGAPTFSAPATIPGITCNGNLNCTGTMLTNTMTTTSVTINGNNGSNRIITGQTAGVTRWAMMLGNFGSESTGNAGSDFSLQAYSDPGSALSTPLSIKRSSGVATFAQPIVNGSDGRNKKEIEPVADALAIVEKLQGVYYRWREGDDRRQVGLVAQDVAEALPEVVFPTGDGDDPMLGISYSNIVAVLINAVKQLSAEVKELKARPA